MAGLPAAAYGGYKDASAAWEAGVLTIGGWLAAGDGAEGLKVPEALREGCEERAAVMVYDGNLPRTEAECLAWAALSPHGEKR